MSYDANRTSLNKTNVCISVQYGIKHLSGFIVSKINRAQFNGI